MPVAPRVAFTGSATSQAADEQALEAYMRAKTPSVAQSNAYITASERSPQLRVEAEFGESGDGTYQATGSHRFDIDDSGSVADQTIDGGGTGADAISVVAVRCPGAGSYTWRALGRHVHSTVPFVVASASARCGAGVTVSRFIERANVDLSTLDVTAPTGTTYQVLIVGYGDFSSPKLDTPFPK